MVAAYTSPVISALMITPIFIYIGESLSGYFLALALIMFLVLVMWTVNILFTWIISKQKVKYNSVKYVLSYFICVVLTLVVVQMMFHGLTQATDNAHGKTFHFHLIVFFAINTVILILQDLVLVKEKNTEIELENARLKMKNMEAANQQLKHQVQPHFLFNSLSTLKALIKNSPQSAEEYLVKLSDFLRFSISSRELDTVKVAEELKLCVDYLAMQKIRFGEALRFAIQVPDGIKEGYQLPIFSLQMLAENAIKHNTLTAEAPLYIDITYNNGTITVSNNLQPNFDIENSGGSGLANLEERYRILSGEGILIEKTGNKFSVSIKVLGYENSNNRG